MEENKPSRQNVDPQLPKGLSKKQRKYAKERLSGKPRKEAAMIAGYSEQTARNAKYSVETPALREAFARMIHIVAPLERMAKVMDEGLNAEKVSISGQGDQAFAEVTPDHQERGRWFDRANKYGYSPEQAIEVNVNHTHSPDDRLAELLGRVAARALEARNAGGEGGD